MVLELVGRKNDAPAADVSAAASGVGPMFPPGSDANLPRRRRRKLDGTARSFHDALMEDLGQPLSTLVGRRDFDESAHPRDDHGKFTDSGDVSSGTSEAAARVMDENPSLVHKSLPFGAALMAPDGRFFGDGNTNFNGTSHAELASKLGFSSLSQAMDADFVRTRMHDSTVAGWGRQIDIEARDMNGVRRAAEKISGAPSDTKVYYDTRREHGSSTIALLAGGGSQSKLGEYGRAVAAGGMYDPEGPGGYASKAWRWLKGLVGRKDNPNHDELGRFASGDGGAISGGAAGRQLHALRSKGGFTYSTILKSTPRVGKVLSIHPERTVITGQKATMEDLDRFVAANKDLLSNKLNYVGGWRDKTDGKVYLDVSAIVSTHAVRLGNQYNQKAYWDLETASEVRLDAGKERSSVRSDPRGLDAGRKAAFPRLPQWRGRVSDEAGRKAVDRLQQQARVRSILYDQKLWDELRAHAVGAAEPIFGELYMGGVEAALRLARHVGHKDFDEAAHPRNPAGSSDGGEFTSGGDAPPPIGYFGYDKPTIKGLPVIGKQGRVRKYETTTDLSKHAEIMQALVAADPEFKVTKDIILDAPSTGWLGTSSWYSPQEDSFLSHKGNDHVDMAWSMFGGHSQDDGVWERSRNPVGGADSPGRDGALAQLMGNGWVRVVGTTEQVGLEATSNSGIRAAAAAIARTNPDIKVFTDLSTPMGIRASVDAVPYGKTATEVAHGTRLGPVGRARQDESLIDPEAYNVKAEGDFPGPLPIDQQLAQRVAIDRARLANEWWDRMETSVRNQLASMLGPASLPEGILDLGAVIDGVTQLFGADRAERIAVTETTRVMGQAAIAAYQILGVEEWEWRTAEDDRVDEICESMRDDGPYSIDEQFEPAHVGCRCWSVPVPPGMKEYAEKEAAHNRRDGGAVPARIAGEKAGDRWR